MNKSALDYMLSAMTSHYHSMLLNGTRYTLSDSYSFLDFCLNFLTRSGFIVFYDEAKHKYVIAK